jgi:hypothetical protein
MNDREKLAMQAKTKQAMLAKYEQYNNTLAALNEEMINASDAEFVEHTARALVRPVDLQQAETVDAMLTLLRKMDNDIIVFKRDAFKLAQRSDLMPELVSQDNIENHKRHAEFLTAQLQRTMRETEQHNDSVAVLHSSMDKIVNSGELGTKEVMTLSKALLASCEERLARDRLLKQFVALKKQWDEAVNLNSQRKTLEIYHATLVKRKAEMEFNAVEEKHKAIETQASSVSDDDDNAFGM